MAEMRRLAASDAAKLKELASLPMSLQEATTAREAAEALVEEHEETVRVVLCVSCLPPSLPPLVKVNSALGVVFGHTRLPPSRPGWRRRSGGSRPWSRCRRRCRRRRRRWRRPRHAVPRRRRRCVLLACMRHGMALWT